MTKKQKKKKSVKKKRGKPEASRRKTSNKRIKTKHKTPTLKVSHKGQIKTHKHKPHRSHKKQVISKGRHKKSTLKVSHRPKTQRTYKRPTTKLRQKKQSKKISRKSPLEDSQSFEEEIIPTNLPSGKEKEAPKKKIKDSTEYKDDYTVIVDNAIIRIKIIKTDRGKIYHLFIPKIDTGTEALLDEIRKELITITSISVGEMADKKAVSKIKLKFMKDAKDMLIDKVPDIKPETQNFLIGILMQDMLGLGKIEFLINDPNLEEIVLTSSKEPVRVYHKKHGWLITNITPKSEDEIINYANIIARRVGRQISILNPLLDAHVVTGDRANAVLYPISTKGNTITIRKFARDPFTMADLIENGTVSLDIASILWIAIEYEMNVLISGGTASGKTVFLNACMPFIPPNHRIISMEDTRELMLPEFLYWVPLVTRTPNPEGKGEVSMLNLLINSLRMRPDRIVLGEIRRQQEAEVLFEAMHTGHSVYATVHADTANETIRRLTNPPINVPQNMLANVNLNVTMFRDRRRGLRRVFQLAEFMPGKEKVTANILYRWVPETDTFVAHNRSLSLFDELGRHTGLSEGDIMKEIQKKKGIFEWIIKNKLTDLGSIGRIMNLYYMDKEKLEKVIRNNQVEYVRQPPEEKKLLSKPKIGYQGEDVKFGTMEKQEQKIGELQKDEEPPLKPKFIRRPLQTERPVRRELPSLPPKHISERRQTPNEYPSRPSSEPLPPPPISHEQKARQAQQARERDPNQMYERGLEPREKKPVEKKLDFSDDDDLKRMRDQIMKIESELKNNKPDKLRKDTKGGF